MDMQTGVLSALGWWQEAGIDMLVDDAPRDWLRPIAPAAPAPAAIPDPTPDPLPATIAALHARLAAPGLVANAVSPPIPPSGDLASGLMLLTDMPESGDAAAGELLTGDAGRLLDRMLAAIGRDRAAVYLAAIAPARPAGGRIAAEAVGELDRLALQHVILAQPKLLLLLGDAPARAILGLSLAEARGRIHDLNQRGATVRVVATFPPRHLLREQGAKAKAWDDLRMLLGEMTR
ncbi:MAG: uracil-DNA glycosylase superfamily protein [Sphingomonas bacterium]|jgi:uracil-DNA glycosylase family 4|nr:uracil-DNA glycosylase superfamily protein [Sphingomonas bacterium]